MFGYVIADLARLDTAQQARYKSFYCGLCRALYRGYGPVPALALTYDMAFLTLFLSALYEPDERSGAARCLRHPVQAQSWTQTEFTSYAAAMNCLLAYENRRDDWHDDQRLSAAAAAGPGSKRFSNMPVCPCSAMQRAGSGTRCPAAAQGAASGR